MLHCIWFFDDCSGEPEAKTWTAGMKKPPRKPGLSSLFPGPAEPQADASPPDGPHGGDVRSEDPAAASQARPSRAPGLSRLYVSDTDTAQGLR